MAADPKSQLLTWTAFGHPISVTLQEMQQGAPVTGAVQPSDNVMLWSADRAAMSIAASVLGGGPGGGIAEAPSDNTSYSRQNAAWTNNPDFNTIIAGNPTAPTPPMATGDLNVAGRLMQNGAPVGGASLPAAGPNGSVLASNGTAAAYTRDLTNLNSVVVDQNTVAALPAPYSGTLIRAAGVDNANVRIEIDSFTSNNGQGPQLSFRRTNGTGALPAPPILNSPLGLINFAGYTAAGYVQAAAIYGRAIEPAGWTNTANGSQLEFYTTALGAAGGTPSDSLRVTVAQGLLVAAANNVPPTGGVNGDMGPGTVNVAAGYYTNGAPVGRIVLVPSWTAGINPNNIFVYRADAARTIVSVVGVVTVTNGAAATVSVRLIPAAGGAGAAIHSGSMDCNAAALAIGDQPLTLTTTVMAAGDRLLLASTGTFTGSIGSIQVTIQ